jgi:large subunit ribosomal protein L13
LANQENVVTIDKPIVVDATDHIAGRLCSKVAKLLLNGNRVSVVNCEKIMMSGTRTNIIYHYRKFLEVNSVIHPRHGPIHARRPDTIMKRMVRGMLPKKKPSGITAHKRLRTYIGTPKELGGFEKIQFKEAKITKSPANYTTVGDIAKIIGWTE